MDIPGIRPADVTTEPFFERRRWAALEIDTSIYELGAIFRASYALTDKYFIFISRSAEEENRIIVALSTKAGDAPARALAGEFSNQLIDHQLRCTLAREAGPLRELIVAQAFSEGNLLDEQRDDGDYQEDPLGIGRCG